MSYLSWTELKPNTIGIVRFAEDVMEDKHLHSIQSLQKGSRQPDFGLETSSKTQAGALSAFGWPINESGVLQPMANWKPNRQRDRRHAAAYLRNSCQTSWSVLTNSNQDYQWILLYVPGGFCPVKSFISGQGVLSVLLFDHSLDQCILGIRIELNINLGGHVIGEIKELFADRHRHENGLCPLFNGQFNGGHGIVDHVNGASQIDGPHYNQSSPQTSFQQAAAKGNHGRQAYSCTTLVIVHGPQLNGKFMAPGITISHQGPCSGIKILLSIPDAFTKGRGMG